MLENLRLYFLFLLLVIPVTSLSANDGESQIFVTPGSTYTPTASETIEKLQRASLPPKQTSEVNEVSVSLVHHHYMERDQFGLLLKVPDITSGCFEVSPLEYEVNFIADEYIDIKVKSFRRTLQETQNPAFDCDQSAQAITGLVVLNATDLQERGIKEIRFSNGKVRDIYALSFSDDSIVMTPQSMIAFKAKGMVGPDKDKLIYQYKGDNIVALHVPMARENDNVDAEVQMLAMRLGLSAIDSDKPLEKTGNRHVYLFEDKRGTALNNLNDDGYAEVGAIRVTRPFIGQRGVSGAPVALKVFITRPETSL